jgi:aryl-alcohol dehydrogenase-like predicted oxidoreductase
MQQRPLGNTGMSVSVLGYGAFKLGRNRQHRYAAGYDLPTDGEVDRILNAVLDAGITLIDTAPAYGCSEEQIGRSIAHRRDEYLLCTKVGEVFDVRPPHSAFGAALEGSPSPPRGRGTIGGLQGSRHDFSGAAVRSSVHRSLQRLRTDRLDVVLVHSNGNDLAIQQQTDVVQVLQDLKTVGDVRAIGFSGKSPDGNRAALAWADVVMIALNPDDVSQVAVAAEAEAAGCGVIVKKGLGSGRLSPQIAIPFVLSHPGVSSLLVSTLSIEHLHADIACADAV